MTFAGSVAEVFDRCLTPVFDPFAKKISQGLPECRTILDVACRTGICTRRLLSVANTGTTLVGVERSSSMIALAARKLFPGAPVGWVRAEAEDLPFGDGAFDVVVCGLGLWHLRDRLLGLEEINRVLLHGGLFRYTVWAPMEQNPWIETVRDTAAYLFPDLAPNWYDAPFEFSDIQDNLNLMEQAGFPEVRLTPLRLTLREPNPLSLARGFVQGNATIRMLLQSRRLPASGLEQAVADELVSRFGDPIRTTMRAFLFEAGALD